MQRLTQKRKLLPALLALSAIASLLSLVVVDRDALISLYRQFGFYLLFLSALWWVLALLPDNSHSLRRFQFCWEKHGILLLAALVTGAMFLVSPAQFRVLADETNLVSVSYSMFMGQSFANVTESLYFYQQHHPLSSTLDIRPNFYPFLIYVVHVLKGYSPFNGFVVNYVAGAASLWLMYHLLRYWFRWQIALFGLFALAAFPVFVLWVTASGFEIVNLAMALLAFYLLCQYLETRSGRVLERLLLTLVLLAQTRYESAVIVIAIVTVLAVSMRPVFLDRLSWRLAAIPWLFLPVAWHRLIKTDKTDYQVYGSDQIFSIDNLLNNLLPALDYFSAKYAWYGTVEWIFYLGVAGFLVGVVRILMRRHQLSQTSEYLFLAAALSLLGLIVVVFSYYWGNLTLAFTLRLGIIFIPFMVVGACYLLHEVSAMLISERNTSGLNKVLVAAGVSLMFLYWPVAARNEGVEKLTLNRLYQNTLAYLYEHYPDHNNLIVTDRPGMYTVHQWGAVSSAYANNKYGKILEGLERRLYQDVIVIQEIAYDTGESIDATAVPEQLQLEPVFETQFDAKKLLRISRVVLDE